MIDEKLINDVEALFQNDCTGHDFHHTIRVMKMASRIAETESADAELAELIALMHDIDDVKLFGSNSRNAEQLLLKYGYPAEIRKMIHDNIGALSFKGTGKSIPDSLEGKIVQDADRLDAMGAIGIARAFAYGGAHDRMIYDPEKPPAAVMTGSDYRKNKGSTINHFYEKLLRLKTLMNTQTAKQIAEERHVIMLNFLESFFDEWDGLK